MELQLGLSLSSCSSTTPSKLPSLKEMDLISYVNCVSKQGYDDNSSILSSQSSVNDQDEGDYDDKKKRGFDEVDSSDFVRPTTTLPLLLWDKHPNEDDKEHKRVCKSSSFTSNKNEGDEVVGWPPIKSYRKNQNDAYNQQLRGRRGGNFPVVDNGGGCGGSRSMYVKVQMEGCFIQRKIDLKLYNSYESLISSLLPMFGKGQCCVDEYQLTYKDGEGDWLLAGDVPWRTFIRSVQRLKMFRTLEGRTIDEKN